MKQYVYYSDFGARGNGVDCDFDAIIAAHESANETGAMVRSDKGATYYIGDSNRTAVIQTDTDWGDARFIIDDSKVDANRSVWVFRVESKLAPLDLTGKVQALNKGQERLNIELERTSLVLVEDDSARRFIRRGINANEGSAQNDVFRVDPQGQVNSNTPIIWDFENISALMAYPIDTTALTLRGGRFTTIANQAEREYRYYSRGIQITRSNVLVDGIRHYIRGEYDTGAPYTGFIYTLRCADITIQNSFFTGHKLYRLARDEKNPMGTYDLRTHQTLDIKIVNVSQTNDITDDYYWGIFSSNFCKNIIFDHVSFSRFDAHQGVHNTTIRNSQIGYHGIKLIGAGIALVENTTVYSGNFIDFRIDYGSVWEGDVIIRDSAFIPLRHNPDGIFVFKMQNDGQHNFGYPVMMPGRITIDGLSIEDLNMPSGYEGILLFENFNPSHNGDEPFPYSTTQELRIRNIHTASGIPFRITNDYLRKNLLISEF